MVRKTSSNSIEQHFLDRPSELHEIYARIVKVAEKFGEVRLEAKKTSIHLCNKTAFAGVRVMSKCIALTIKSDKDLEDSRICQHEQTSANRWHLLIKLHSMEDVDKEVRQWLRNAYQLSG